MPLMTRFGLNKFDASTIQSGQREVTQIISRLVYESGADGILYPSKHGHEFKNWAIFESDNAVPAVPEFGTKMLSPSGPDDPDFLACLGLLNLRSNPSH